MVQNYKIQHSVSLIELERQYLAYSGLSSETVVLEYYVFYLLNLLSQKEYSINGLVSALKNAKIETDNISTNIVQILNEYIGRGFIKHCDT